MLTRGNLASNAAVLAEVWRFSESGVLLHSNAVGKIQKNALRAAYASLYRAA